MVYLRILFLSITIFAVHASIQWLANQPQEVGQDVPSGKLASLSFAPFREGFDPLEKIYPLPEHVDEDMGLLADKTQSIRTYSSLGGMQPVPEFARKHGVSVIQGAWLGNEDPENQKEIAALIQSANANPDVVKRVIVGNEVLLRGDLTVERLIDYIRQVKRAVKQPVSYADVWSRYMKYPQLFAEVDFITIHILPYWEDEPISVDHAAEHLEKIVKQVEDEARGVAAGKPILIGESGWPSAGRQRGQAIPSVVNSAKYTRDMVAVVNRHGFDYNIVEAFNQPWKSKLEGVVGANWGLISANRTPVFPLSGKVLENPDWLWRFSAATLIWLGLMVACRQTLSVLSWGQSLAWLVLAQVFSVSLVWLADFLWYTSYSHWQRLYTALMVIANSALGWLLLQRASQLLQNQTTNPKHTIWLRQLFMCFLVVAFYKALGFIFNGRYLSFPIEQFTLPAAGIAGLIVCQLLGQPSCNAQSISFNRLIGDNSLHSRDHWLAYGLFGAIVGILIAETHAFMVGGDFILAHPGFSEGLPFAISYTLGNQQLIEWLLILFVLAIPFLPKFKPAQ